MRADKPTMRQHDPEPFQTSSVDWIDPEGGGVHMIPLEDWRDVIFTTDARRASCIGADFYEVRIPTDALKMLLEEYLRFKEIELHGREIELLKARPAGDFTKSIP